VNFGAEGSSPISQRGMACEPGCGATPLGALTSTLPGTAFAMRESYPLEEKQPDRRAIRIRRA
jgi:hypothetical protein